MMLQHEKTPCQAVGLARGATDLRHLEHALSIKQTELQQEKPPATAAGLYVCRRFHINPVIADLIASLAGLGPNRRAA
jgi:hypothetical protein